MIALNRVTSVLVAFVQALVIGSLAAIAAGQQPAAFDHAGFDRRVKDLSPQQADELVTAAYSKRDIETLMACVTSPVTSASFYYGWSHADDDLKARLAVRMLRSETLFKPFPPLAILRGGAGVEQIVFMGMVVAAASGKLANVDSTDQLLENRDL